jgi:acetolactate synthase-1/2/3 large subunit
MPGTFITPSGLATMGFGPAAVLGVKMAHPDRAAVSLVGDGGFSTNPVSDRDGDGSGTAGRLAGDGQRRFGTIAGLESSHYGWSFGCMFERCGKPYRVDYAAMARACGANGVLIESATNSVRRCARRWPRTADRHSGADGERANADPGPLEHQRHLRRGE